MVKRKSRSGPNAKSEVRVLVPRPCSKCGEACDGPSSWNYCLKCSKEYRRAWYLKRKSHHIAMVAKNNARYQRRNKAYIKQSLKRCVDCGIEDWRVLEFDHLRDKRMNVANMLTWSLKALMAEIAKCEVVCANCHRIRTSNRGGFWRTNNGLVPALPSKQ